MSSIPFLTTDGDAHARGLAHGRRFAREIADNVATYLRRFAASGLDRDAAFSEAEIWCQAIAAQSPTYAEEMRGIADGSGQSEQAIALLNARYEVAFTLFGQEATQQRSKGGELLEVGPDGCTTFGLLPEATADRHTWLGQNWDWLEGVHGRTFVLRARRTDQPSFVCLTEAGIAGGKMGVNECGIGLVENGLASSHDGRNPYLQAVPRALPRSAGCGTLRSRRTAGDRHAAHLLGQFRHRLRPAAGSSTSRSSPDHASDIASRGRHHHAFQSFPDTRATASR